MVFPPDLLAEMRERLGMAILLITHDMGVVAETTNRVVVMYAGKVVEDAAMRAFFAAPGAQRSALFLETWTRKEAVCKAAGLPLDTMRGRETAEGPGDPDGNRDGADKGSAGGFHLHTAAE